MKLIYYKIRIFISKIRNEKPLFLLWFETPIYKWQCHKEFLHYNPCENSIRPDGTFYLGSGLCIDFEGEIIEDLY